MLSKLDEMLLSTRAERLEAENNELAATARLLKVDNELLKIKLAKANRKLDNPVLVNNG